MERLQRDAVIISLIENLRKKGSWCGETHIQKATYFLQRLFDVPLGFEFILYKHGPFSFDLSDELTAMQADMLIRMHLKPRPYGPSLILTDGGEMIKKNYPVTIKNLDPEIRFVSEKFKNKGVAELERLSTALFVTHEIDPNGSVDSRAKSITELKPHVKISEALDAVKSIDEIIEKSRKVKNA